MTLTYEFAYKMIQDSLDSLHRTGLITKAVIVQNDTVLLGVGSLLDSLAFVTFITELEDRLSREYGQELYLILKDIHETNSDNPSLLVENMAHYIVKLTEGV